MKDKIEKLNKELQVLNRKQAHDLIEQAKTLENIARLYSEKEQIMQALHDRGHIKMANKAATARAEAATLRKQAHRLLNIGEEGRSR